MSTADRDSLARLQSGDLTALAELYDRYAALLHPVALRITGDGQAADEAVFDTFLTVARRTVAYEPRRAVAGWLVSLVRAHAMERRAQARGHAAGAAPASDGPVGVSAERVALSDEAAEALAGLEAEERRTLDLAFFDGLTRDDIAGRTATSPAQVAARIHAGMERLCAHLAGPREEAA
jgi:RNA polymerase sigma-70 factor (ECF subfamily)